MHRHAPCEVIVVPAEGSKAHHEGMTADSPHLAMRKPEGAEPFFAHHRRYDDCFARPQAETVFYRKATFYSAAEVDALMGNTAFDERIWL